MDLVRTLVSKKKRRWEYDGYNLDLTYITDQIIAMGFPSEGTEGLFRNPLSEVQRFLKERHEGHFHVYNLCVERNYKSEKFGGKVSVFPFADHNAPSLALIKEFCEHVHDILTSDAKNIAAVHCKAGKGHTGTMICCYLLYCGALTSAADVLEFYGVRRTLNGHGVTIPSQRRYVHYFAEQITPNWDSARERLHWNLRRIDISAIPRKEDGYTLPMWKPLFGVTRKDNTLLYVGSDDSSNSLVPTFQCDGLPVQGDIKFELFNGKSTKRFFWFWINTAFIQAGQCTVTLYKNELDGAVKDKEHKIFPADFHVALHFERILGRARNKGSRAPPPSGKIIELGRSVSPATINKHRHVQVVSAPPNQTSVINNTLEIRNPHQSQPNAPTYLIAGHNRTNIAHDLDDDDYTPVAASPPPPSLTESMWNPSFSKATEASTETTNRLGIDRPDSPDWSASCCFACGLPISNSSQSLQYQGQDYHWSCICCSVCSEPLGERRSCTITDTTTISKAMICGNCDSFWVRCALCKQALTDDTFSPTIPNIGKLCQQCFSCSICRAPFSRTDEDDYDEDVDAFDIVDMKLICRSHTISSRKIFSEKQRPRTLRNFACKLEPVNPTPLISTGASSTESSSPETDKLKTRERPVKLSRPNEAKLSLRKVRGLALEMSRCAYCHGLIDLASPSVFVQETSKTYHSNHFKCNKCTASILSGDLYHIMAEQVWCNDCFSKSAACFKCQKPLVGLHKQIGPEIFVHCDCFSCENCHNEIQGSFTEVDGKTLCLQCVQPSPRAPATEKWVSFVRPPREPASAAPLTLVPSTIITTTSPSTP